jgi:NTP pyrophosphatase (non-canonical NTP hydrolase)
MTDLITLPRATVQQALEALEDLNGWQSLAPPLASQVGRHAAINLRAALEQPEQEQPVRAESVTTPPCKGMNCGAIDGRSHSLECHAEHSAAIAGGRFVPLAQTAALEQPVQEPAFDALVAISLLTHLGGEVAEYADVVEAVRRLHALNGELGAALRRLISYCNTLENRLMEADGEHPAVQEAKEAYAKVEGKV